MPIEWILFIGFVWTKHGGQSESNLPLNNEVVSYNWGISQTSVSTTILFAICLGRGPLYNPRPCQRYIEIQPQSRSVFHVNHVISFGLRVSGRCPGLLRTMSIVQPDSRVTQGQFTRTSSSMGWVYINLTVGCLLRPPTSSTWYSKANSQKLIDHHEGV